MTEPRSPLPETRLRSQSGAPDPRTSPGVPAEPLARATSGLAFNLVAKGFTHIERSLLQGIVMVSQRRTPRLQLLAESDIANADVVIVDALDPAAAEWASRQTTLAEKAVIWVDGQTSAPGHLIARRPVQWPSLPMLLARAVEANRVRQPAPEAVDIATQEPPDASISTATPPPILVVDDSLAIRAYLTSQLEARNYRVVQAESADAALRALTTGTFSCVLMDVLMPGIDGYEGCKQIKARMRGISNLPVIMLTSKASPFDRIRGKMAGCDAYLTKPVDTAQLQRIVNQYVRIPVTFDRRPLPL